MTGDTENGRSISAIKKERPLNRNFVTDHAAASPKTTLRGTTIAAMAAVSRIELQVSQPDRAPSRVCDARPGLAGALAGRATCNTRT